jgi:two-component system response regulator FixJ
MQDQLIAVIDDDEALRRSMDSLLTRAGFDVKTFESGDNFLGHGSGPPFSCIILDMQMPGRDGLAVLRALGGRAESPPVIVLTGHGDIAVAVRAMKLGADNFIEKPVAADALLAAIENAFSRARARARARIDALGSSSGAAALVAALTDRQRQVLRGILRGKQNKIIAFELGLSIRTIEAYRSQLLSKLGVRGTADAVRLALTAGFGEEAPAGPSAPRPARAAARATAPDGPYVGFRAHR